MTERWPDPGEWISMFIVKSVSTAIIDGTSVNAETLCASSTRYNQATIKAMKPGVNALTMPTANTSTVWICQDAEDLTGAFSLGPGQTMSLPDDGDLTLLYLAVETVGDGVLIIYV